MTKEKLHPKNSEIQTLDMARSILGQVKELPLTEKEKVELNFLIDQAKANEKNHNLAGALIFYNQIKKLMEKVRSRPNAETLEQKIDMQIQYEEQVEVLKKYKVVKESKNGELVMTDINGKEWIVPGFKNIMARLSEKTEFIDKKIEQGFGRLLMVPFGAKLSSLRFRAIDFIAEKHKKTGKIFDHKGKVILDALAGSNDRIELDRRFGLADQEGNMVYHINNFDLNNHGGQTKSEIIAAKGGWQVILMKDFVDLSLANETEIKSGRQDFKPTLRPEEYLKIVHEDPQYEDEKIFTPEAELTYLMQYFSEHDQMIDCAVASWNLGAFFKGSITESLTGFPTSHWWERHFKIGLSQAPFEGMYGFAHSIRTFVEI